MCGGGQVGVQLLPPRPAKGGAVQSYFMEEYRSRLVKEGAVSLECSPYMRVEGHQLLLFDKYFTLTDCSTVVALV